MRYRIRKKGKVDVVEKLEGKKVFSKTLDPEKTWDWAVSKNMSKDMSGPTKGNEEEEGQKCVQGLLTEQNNKDIIGGVLEEVGL